MSDLLPGIDPSTWPYFVRYPRGLFQYSRAIKLRPDARRLLDLIVEIAVSHDKQSRCPRDCKLHPVRVPHSDLADKMGWLSIRRKDIPSYLRELDHKKCITWKQGSPSKLGTRFQNGIIELSLDHEHGLLNPTIQLEPSPHTATTVSPSPWSKTSPQAESTYHRELKRSKKGTKENTVVSPSSIRRINNVKGTEDSNGTAVVFKPGIQTTRCDNAKSTPRENVSISDAETHEQFYFLKLCLNKLGVGGDAEKTADLLKAFARGLARDVVIEFLVLVVEGDERRISPGKYKPVKSPVSWAIGCFLDRHDVSIRESARRKAKRVHAEIEGALSAPENGRNLAPDFRAARVRK